jgi:hypothetical protein
MTDDELIDLLTTAQVGTAYPSGYNTDLALMALARKIRALEAEVANLRAERHQT